MELLGVISIHQHEWKDLAVSPQTEMYRIGLVASKRVEKETHPQLIYGFPFICYLPITSCGLVKCFEI